MYLEFAKSRLIYCVRAGSHMYGLNDADSDDDFIGTYVLPVSQALGFAECKHVRNSEPDENYTALREFVGHLVNGSQYWVETLFAPDECIATCHTAFRPILNCRESFITKALLNKSRKFMSAMAETPLTDPKFAKKISHGARVGYMLLNWIGTGEFSPLVDEQHVDCIKSIKHNAVDMSVVKADIERMAGVIVDEIDKCQLCDVVNPDLVNQLILEASLAYWAETGEL